MSFLRSLDSCRCMWFSRPNDNACLQILKMPFQYDWLRVYPRKSIKHVGVTMGICWNRFLYILYKKLFLSISWLNSRFWNFDHFSPQYLMSTIGVHLIPRYYSTYTTKSKTYCYVLPIQISRICRKEFAKRDQNYKNNDFFKRLLCLFFIIH